MESLMSEKKLYVASLRGDIQSLNDLFREDELVLSHYGSSSGFCFSETPLHIAAARGHVDFAKVLLQHKPDLVNELDSRLRAPLHLASVKGQVEMVKLLLEADGDVCFYEDESGRTPLHLAAMVKGRVEVVNELVRARPEAILNRLNRTKTLTILHSYVILNGPKALDQLVEVDLTFLDSQDAEGNTILHKVVALKQLETLKYLISQTQLDINSKNGDNFTTLDIIETYPRDSQTTEMRELLVKAGALNGERLSAPPPNTTQLARGEIDQINVNPVPVSITDTMPPSRDNVPNNKEESSLVNKWDSKVVAATVIAGMAYQAGLNPPGGVFDQDGVIYIQNLNKNVNVTAGTSIMSTKYPRGHNLFWALNTATLVASLSMVLLLISGPPRLGTSWFRILKRKVFMCFLTGAIWVTTTTLGLTYIFAVIIVTPDQEFVLQLNGTNHIVGYSVVVWLAFVFIVFLFNAGRFLVRIIVEVAKCIKGSRRNASEGERQGHSNANTTTCCMFV